jgi:hypothetical protein
VGEALVTTGAGLPEVEGDGFGVGVGVGVGAGVGLADAEGLDVPTAQLGVGVGPRMIWLTGENALPPPSSSRPAGTTSMPRMTVITKARAPHSWRQKASDELRIRVLRPAPAEVCCGC